MFAPSARLSLLGLLACVAFVRLGVWQWHRGQEREAQWSEFARGAGEPIALGARGAGSVPLYQRVSVTGQFDPAHQFLLDNRAYRGRPGYEVLAPLLRPGAPALLVDRGWVAFTGSRARLPEVGFSGPAPVRLTGRLAPLPAAGLALGHAAPAQGAWPKLTAFPRMEELAAAFGAALEPRILLLDTGAPLGLVRDWQPPGMAPLRHYSYAVQWWSFAGLTLLLWALLAFRRDTRTPPR